MAAQTIPFVPNQPPLTDHQPHRLAPAIPTALISDSLLLRSGLRTSYATRRLRLPRQRLSSAPRRLQHCALNTALVIIEATQNTGRVLEIVRQVRDRNPEARIVVLADHFDLSFVLLGHEAGVNGFCLEASLLPRF